MNTFLSFPDAVARIWLLDRNEQEIKDDGGQRATLLAHEIQLSGPMRIPFGLQTRRPLQLFGRKRPFWAGTFEVDVSNQLRKQCRYVVLDIVPGDMTNGSAVREGLRTCGGNCIRLEMSRKKLNAAGPSALFLLITKHQAARRIKKIIGKKPVLRGQKQATMLGLSDLMVELFRGGDTPLLTEDL